MKSLARLFISILITIPIISLAANVCSQNGYTVATINGILTDDAGAKENKRVLEFKLGKEYMGESIDVQYLLNPSHLGGIGDLAMAAYQKALEDETVSDYDLIEMLNSASQKVQTKKLLLVAHSQGNFYANSFYDTVADKVGGVPAQSIGIYSVATPADRVAGEGKWLTSDTDRVIAWYVGHIPGKKIKATNTSIAEASGSWDPIAGHDFAKVYLEYRGDKIVSNIKESLSQLSADNTRSENASCIEQPKLTIVHKIEGSILAVADPLAALAVNNISTNGRALYAATMFASNFGQTFASVVTSTFSDIAQSAIHATGNLASALWAAAKSIVGKPNIGIAGNSGASAILAVAPSTTTAPQPTLGQPRASQSPQQSVMPPVPTPVPSSTPTAGKPIATTPSGTATSLQGNSSASPTLSTLSGVDLGGGVAPIPVTEEKKKDDSKTTGGSTNGNTSGDLGGGTQPAAPAYQSIVTPIAPASTTLTAATTTFLGTYSNAATFDKIAFELKNTSLNTATSTVLYTIATTTGENLSFTKEITLESEGDWQYRARLEDSVTASSTTWSALLKFALATSTPKQDTTGNQTVRKSVYSNNYIGTPADVSTNSPHFFPTINLLEDVYSIRFLKASDLNCATDINFGTVAAGDSVTGSNIAQLDISSARTNGKYCEYHFTSDYLGPVIKAGIPVSKIRLNAARPSVFLEGSIYNEGNSANWYGTGMPTGGFAFQFCGVEGCGEEFILPPDGVRLNTPTKQTYIYAPTFTGTYNNNAILNTRATYKNGATFNKLVFEFKNTTLDTATTTIKRSISANGSVQPYTEKIDIPSRGEWQYRVRLEDTINASSTPWSALAYFAFEPRNTENQAKSRTVYAHPYIGNPISLGSNAEGYANTVSFWSENRLEDIYSIRFKKASDFDCRNDPFSASVVVGFEPLSQRIVELDPTTATTDGSYCEYTFTEARTAIPASIMLSKISFYITHNGVVGSLDASLSNNASLMDANGIWHKATTFAFQLCNLAGCDGKFLYPPDGVTPTKPTKQTYVYSPTFAGTYNNNAILNTQATYTKDATFDKLVFEFKNLTLGTASTTIKRPISARGSVIHYTEQIDIPTRGEWQYSVRLEDSVNASSTPWSELAYFAFEPRNAENRSKAKTVYEEPYIGSAVDVGNSWSSNSSVNSVIPDRTEDIYSIRVKKITNFDCRNDPMVGHLSYTWGGVITNRIVYFDPTTATTDGSYCEYTFTEDRTAVSANSGLSDIGFSATHNGEHVFLDGAVENAGWARNGYGGDPTAASFAFQLCNLAGCSSEFKLPPSGTPPPPPPPPAPPVLSSAHTITGFSVAVGTSTVIGTITETPPTISLGLPAGTDVKSLVPTIAVSAGATISPASGIPQDFTRPITYTVTAEDASSTQSYLVIATVATPPPLAITSYTFNGTAGDITVDFATSTPEVAIALTASENVDWVSIKIEDQSNPANDKIFYDATGCVNGTATCTKLWNGTLSDKDKTPAPNGTYRIKVHMKDPAGNPFDGYLAPYSIIVKR